MQWPQCIGCGVVASHKLSDCSVINHKAYNHVLLPSSGVGLSSAAGTHQWVVLEELLVTSPCCSVIAAGYTTESFFSTRLLITYLLAHTAAKELQLLIRPEEECCLYAARGETCTAHSEQVLQ